MKVVLPTSNDSLKATKGAAVLPLVPEEPMVLTKENSIQLELATDPAHMMNSPKFKMSAYVLRGGEDVRTCILWQKDIPRIFHGLNLVGGQAQRQMVENLLADTALTLFNSDLDELATARRLIAANAAEAANPGVGADAAVLGQDLAGHTEPEDVINAIHSMITKILPRQILARVKRYLRRECRKPADMKVRIYLQHILRINRSEFQHLPPYRADQNLSDEEILDIVLFGTPKFWHKEMDRQGFDPMNHDINQVVDFMEQIEAAEDFDPNPKNKSKDKSKGKGKNNQPKKSGNGKSNEFCLYHGECSHSTEDCSVIKSLASQKKAKTSNSNNRGNSSGNWKKRAEEHGNKSKKDWAAFIKKEVKKGVDKGLAKKKSAKLLRKENSTSMP